MQPSSAINKNAHGEVQQDLFESVYFSKKENISRL